MKIRSRLALVGLAISVAAPALAQEQNTVDPKARSKYRSVLKQHEEAYNEYDASAFADWLHAIRG